MKLLPVPTEPADVALLLHEATVVGHYGDEIVVQRRRPFIPCGADPAPINAECARFYLVSCDLADVWRVAELTPEQVTPFVDVAAQLAADDVRANRAQAANKRKP